MNNPALQHDGNPAVGRPFTPGVSGNPSGKRKGTVSLRAAIKRALTRADADAIAAKLIADAKTGDRGAVKLLLQFVPDDPLPWPDCLDPFDPDA